MMAPPQISIADARRVLRVAAGVDAAQLRRAFHTAVLRAHPDRPGGDIAAFSLVMEAYGRLRNAAAAPQPVTPPPPPADTLTITPLRAMRDGLRNGDIVEGQRVAIRNEPGLQVRGHDLWITVPAQAATLAQGGRLTLDTPFGERVVWITRKRSGRNLIRLPDGGLPARGPHPQGDLYVRLSPQAPAESAAYAQRRRFAATWAA